MPRDYSRHVQNSAAFIVIDGGFISPHRVECGLAIAPTFTINKTAAGAGVKETLAHVRGLIPLHTESGNEGTPTADDSKAVYAHGFVRVPAR